MRPIRVSWLLSDRSMHCNSIRRQVILDLLFRIPCEQSITVQPTEKCFLTNDQAWYSRQMS